MRPSRTGLIARSHNIGPVAYGSLHLRCVAWAFISDVCIVNLLGDIVMAYVDMARTALTSLASIVIPYSYGQTNVNLLGDYSYGLHGYGRDNVNLLGDYNYGLHSYG